MTIWNQGQFYPKLGKKIIELPYHVDPGPHDQQIKVEGFEVEPDEQGNFLNRDYSEDELDAIHTYGIARTVIDLFEGFIGNPIAWSWQQNGDQEPLRIKIRNHDINSRFLIEQKCIELDYYGASDNLVYSCRTVDLVAHEVGHAIINSIFPKWHHANVEARGMEEAFCDLCAMFLVLSQIDLCQEVVRETSGELTQPSILSLFGVGHGFFGNPHKEIRNALNKKIYSTDFWSTYDYAEVLIGILYAILIDLYNYTRGRVNDVDVLYKVSNYGKMQF